jgi:predicted nucleic-acid-binding Zn-ribbon protein
MSTEEMRHCTRCGTITAHEVITNRGIVASLCHACFGQMGKSIQTQREARPPGTKLLRKENSMETQTIKVKPKTRISYYEIACEACNLSQFYHGKSHTKCIHCMAPLDLRKLKPKYQ